MPSPDLPPEPDNIHEEQPVAPLQRVSWSPRLVGELLRLNVLSGPLQTINSRDAASPLPVTTELGLDIISFASNKGVDFHTH